MATLRRLWRWPYAFGKILVIGTIEDDLLGAATEVAFNLLLAIFPFLIFLAALTGFIGAAVGIEGLFAAALAYLEQVLPPQAIGVVTGPLTEVLGQRSGGLLSLGLLGAIWAASNAVAAIMKALNRAHGVKETRPLWLHRGVLPIGLTLLLSLLIPLALVLFFFGEEAGLALARWLGLQTFFGLVFGPLRGLLIVLAIMIALAVLYWLGPAVRQPFRPLTAGSVSATLLWLAFTWGFQVFLQYFNRYPSTYGALTGVVILMLWLNYSVFVILLGAEIDQAVRATRDLAAPRPPDGG